MILLRTMNQNKFTTKPDYITHIIACKLEEKNIIIFIDDDKKEEISLLISNKDIIKEEHLDLSEVITNSILEDVICFNGDKQKMIDIINNIINKEGL